MNASRLEKSLHILRELNTARALRATKLVSKYEAILKQHDYDARDKIDPRQMTIFEAQKT
jgi:hypothetical protein